MSTTPDDQERRLATILAADIVGYSRQMDAHEESTYAALRSVRSDVIEPKIEEHRGRIVKHTGDGFLAEFPTVMAAIQFAMSLQEEMGRRVEGIPDDDQIKFRIGVNLGDIIVDDDNDIFGDGVNVAARLEGLGIPGGICISGPVYESVHKKLDVGFDDLGVQSVKNISTPVHAYDIRWPGEAGTPDERIAALAATPKTRRMIAVGAMAAMAVIGFFLWQLFLSEPEIELAPENSVAVLPFVNMSADPDQEYFSDGISEELLNLLARIPELRVTSRTSAFSYKGKDIDIPTIAKQLNVAYILEGSVRKGANQVRITAQLIEARSDIHLWSETYDRALDDIFAVQDEIAATVVEQLKITLLGDAPTVQATNPEAYALVLQARYLVRQGTLDAGEKSVALLEQALAIDPGYAAAWTGLAFSHIRQANTVVQPIDEGFRLARRAASETLALARYEPYARLSSIGSRSSVRDLVAPPRPIDVVFRLARGAANKALALDPEFVPAYRVLGHIARFYDRDFVAAARHIERVLVMEPANSDNISDAARLAHSLGRLNQAIALGEYAAARDPVSLVANFNLGVYYLDAGRSDEAITSLRTALTLSPGFSMAQYFIGSALLLKGEPQAALTAMQEESTDVWRLSGLAMAYQVLDDAAAANAALAALIEKYGQDAAYNIAYVLAYRGEADRAFEWLDKAVVYKDPGLAEIATQRQFTGIQSDPRWLPFLESIGQSPEQLAAIEFNVTAPK